MRFLDNPTRLGATLAIVLLILDQATKYGALYILDWGATPSIAVLPFFDLTLVWNRGISYGLFAQDSGLGMTILTIVSFVAAIGFSIWLAYVDSKWLAIALGLLISGAIGNGLDRAFHGAVIDFVSLHAYGFYWYVFNIADVAIVIGVVVLLIDGVWFRRNLAENED